METLGQRVVGTAELQVNAQRPVPRAAARADIRLTARGAVLGLFVACFVTLLLSAWTGWSALADLAFVGGCAAGAWYTKRGALLAVVVSPPLIFFIACLLVELLTSSGTIYTLEGIFVTLGTSAPWLFLGTALTLGIALFRGLPGEFVDIFDDLRVLWKRLTRGAEFPRRGE